MKFRLEGFKELEAALEDVAKKSTQVAITRRALRKAAEPMRDKAKQYASIDTGALEDSIKISTRAVGEAGNAAYFATMKAASEAAKAAGEVFNRDDHKADAAAAMIAARRTFKGVNPPAILYLGPARNAWYAKFVELGTKDRFHESGKFVGKMTPDPFLRPAFDAEAQGAIDRLAPLIWEEIQKHKARAAKRAAKG